MERFPTSAADPQSVAVADYYVSARQIPAANVVHLTLPVGQNVLSQVDFAAAKAIVDAALGDEIQALAITWTLPYRVDCMSITSAFAHSSSPWNTRVCTEIRRSPRSTTRAFSSSGRATSAAFR